MGKKWHIPFIFDVEDYHPGEFIRFDTANEKYRREFLMKKLLPEAAAITSASPLIGKYTLDLIGGHPNHQVILNSFPQGEFIEPPNHQINSSTNQLKLVWFSQKISFGRGLEQLFEALQLLGEDWDSGKLPFHLTLIGDLDAGFDVSVISGFRQGRWSSCLTILPPMKQGDLHRSLAKYDIGLALEPGKDLNNLLAVSNKIIAYAQAGLYILATDTPAQKQFIQQHESCGLLCGQTAEGMRDGILAMIYSKKDILENRSNRDEMANDFTWEKESLKFSKLINNIQTNKKAIM
jgi:glycosyltransferase involved in cell wall biosynthesis